MRSAFYPGELYTAANERYEEDDNVKRKFFQASYALIPVCRHYRHFLPWICNGPCAGIKNMSLLLRPYM